MDGSWPRWSVWTSTSAGSRSAVAPTASSRPSKGSTSLVEVDGVSHRVSRDEGGLVRAPAPGLVVAVPAKVDDVVEAGATVVVLEAMKMETAIAAPVAGRVREVFVAANVQVDAGAALLRLEPQGDEQGSVGAVVPLEELIEPWSAEADPRRPRRCRVLRSMRWVLLGYDFDAPSTSFLLERYLEERGRVAPDDEAVLAAELRLLTVFADISELSRNRRVDPRTGTARPIRRRRWRPTRWRAASASTCSPTCAPSTWSAKASRPRSQPSSGGPWPTSGWRTWNGRLRSRRRCSGCSSRTSAPPTRSRSSPLSCTAWTSSSAGRAPASRAPVSWTRCGPRSIGSSSPPSSASRPWASWPAPFATGRSTGRSSSSGERRRTPAWRPSPRSSTDPLPARGVRRRWWSSSPAPTPSCPRRWVASSRWPNALIHSIEAVVRRYYVIRDLRDVEATVSDGHQLVTARYDGVDTAVDVVAVATTADRLGSAVGRLAAEAEARGTSGVVVGELYVRTDEPVDDDVWSARLTEVLSDSAMPANVRRVAASVANPMAAAALQTAHEAVDGRFVEARPARGLHPMIAERLQLWRLVNFAVERLPSAPEVTVLDCTARDNPGDERLITLAEVRDLTMVRDADGRVVALPELEHVLAVCVGALRNARAARTDGRRLEWNRIVLYVVAHARCTARPARDRRPQPRAADRGGRPGAGARPGTGAARLGRPARGRRTGRQPTRRGRDTGGHRPAAAAAPRRTTGTRTTCSRPGVEASPTRTSSCRCSRRCPAVRPAPSRSTTSTSPAPSARWTGRRDRTRRASSSVSSARRRRCIPRAWCGSC